jgi:3-isopropylmalate dehydrogenase
MYKIAVLKGDGIGPEIVEEAIKVLQKIAEVYHHEFVFKEGLIGGDAIDKTGVPLPKDTVALCKSSDAVLLGAVGGAKWDNQPPNNRPETGLLQIREQLELFANLRPATMYEALADACPIKKEVIGNGFDLLVVRELTGDVYFGAKGRKCDNTVGYDIMNYSVNEVERIARVAFEMAMRRRKKLCSVDKANVLETSRVWRETMHRIKEEYPQVEYSDMYVDNCAMQLVRNPNQFDVIVTGNLFGDILSDEASMITGSIGLLPSASIGATSLGLYEPIHGSAPDIAGKGIANPIATILSAAMMLRYSFSLSKEADAIENAVKRALALKYHTADIAMRDGQLLSTKEMGDMICSLIQ